MKICEFTEHDLNNRVEEKTGRYCVMPTATQRAIQLLFAALSTVNQAGLDGKELSDLTLVTRCEPTKHPDDQVYEIHAKVKHRLAPKP